MKKLITAKDIEALVRQGEKKLYIEECSIVTAAAHDAARSAGVEITTDKQPEALPCEADCCGTEGEITSDVIYKALQQMLSQGMISGVSENCCDTPYCAESHENGLKLVRGKTVKMDFLETGTPGAKAHFQEVITGDDGSHVGAGFLEIDDSSFEWTLEGYEEIDYVIEGTLSISVNDRTFTAKAGDVFFVPSGAKVVWASPDKAKVFFTTFAVN